MTTHREAKRSRLTDDTDRPPSAVNPGVTTASDPAVPMDGSADHCGTERDVEGDSEQTPGHGADRSTAASSHDAGGTTEPTADPDPSSMYSDLILTSESRRGVYECDYCHSDISQLPRIRCAVCVDFDLCLDCFLLSIARNAAPSLSSNHDPRTHGYRVCDSTRYPLFPPIHGSAAGGPGLIRTMSSNVGQATEAVSSQREACADRMEPSESQETQSHSPPTSGEPRPDPSSEEAAPMDEPAVPAAMRTTEAAPTKETRPLSSVLSRQVSSVSAMSAGDEMSVSVGGIATNSPVIGELFTVTDPKIVWTVEEDLRLLEGIRKHGLGNWLDVADAVAGQGSVGKTPKRCMERYLDGFLGRYGCILPPIALDIGSGNDSQETKIASKDTSAWQANEETEQDTESNTDTLEKRSSKRRAAFLRSPSGVSGSMSMSARKKFRTIATESLDHFQDCWTDIFLPNDKVQVGQDVGRDQAYRAEQQFVKAMASLESAEQVEELRKEWEDRLGKPGGPTVLPMRVEDLANLPGSEILGFMPRRGDFDIEYENEAEQVVADMEFLPGEPAADRELKLKVLAIYNSKLDERERRKQYVLSRGLYNYRKIQIEEQKMPRDERDLIHRMRIFERFHTPQEHEQFIADLLKAKRLRKEIAKLQTYRSLGIRTLAEAEQYEVYKARRAFHAAAALQKEADAARSAEDKSRSMYENKRLNEDSESNSLWKQYRTKARKERLSLSRNGDVIDESSIQVTDEAGADEDTEMMEESKVDETTAEGSTIPVEAEGKSADQDEPSSNSDPSAVNLSSLPGYEFLSHREVDLCCKVGLTPMQYQEIKQAILMESLSKGLLDNEPPHSNKRSLVKIDVQKRGRVIDFMVSAGWISLPLSG